MKLQRLTSPADITPKLISGQVLEQLRSKCKNKQTEINSCAKGQYKADGTLLCPTAPALVLVCHRQITLKLSADSYSPLTWTPHNFVT